MIIVQHRLDPEVIRTEAAQAIITLKEWFRKNRSRNVCNTKIWYGKMIPVNRDSISLDIMTAAEKAING